MLHTTKSARLTAAIGAALVSAMFAVPAAASDGGTQPGVSGFDDPAPTSITDPRVREELNRIDSPPVDGGTAPAPTPEPTTVFLDDGSLEMAQIALGAVAGVALGAAGVGLLRRRHGMQPA